MSLPFIFVQDMSADTVTLEEDASKHVISVLRMQKGEKILLTDGKGNRAEAEIIDDHRKRCEVRINSREYINAIKNRVTIGISLVKNSARFEWFLEKATEIGVTEIIPLICERTEKEKFRYDRMHNILVSAMLQSQQCWLPILQEPVEFPGVIQLYQQSRKFIAHCIPQKKQQLSSLIFESMNETKPSIILIGPEGDFTEKEIQIALNNEFIPVALGSTRLRTETAGLVAASLLLMERTV